jgi:glycolate oxidase
MSGLDFVSNQEIILAARRNLGQGAWDYLVGGSESETTMRRNRLGFDRLALRPRVLVDVSKVDASTSFLGHPLRVPVLLAPIGSLQVLVPEGATASARGAAAFGTVPVVSSSTEPSLEETAAASDSPKIFQLYVQGDMAWVENILGRVKDAGYAALCLTVDVAVYSRRERPMVDRWLPPTRRTPRDPRWRASVTWDMMDRIKQIAGLPFLLKGVATAEDAATAVEHGVDVVWVSNHGGRQLDHGQATIDMLPEIVQAVDGRAEIVVDGGIQRGTDVLKAVALGAKAVAIGKLHGWGLAAAGAEGLVRVLELLEDEILIAMGLLGITRLDQLSPSYLCGAEPVTLPHEMSAFPGILGGRVL